MTLCALDRCLTHQSLLCLLLGRALPWNYLSSWSLSLSCTISFTAIRPSIWLRLWILLGLHPALVYVQNDLLLGIWYVLRCGSWTCRSLDICSCWFHFYWWLYLNIRFLPFSLIWVNRQIPIHRIIWNIILRQYLLFLKRRLRIRMVQVWVEISVDILIMVVGFISWLDRVVRVRSVLLFFRLCTHHRIYFRNNLIIPLTILLRAVNTFGDHVAGVFGRVSLGAEPTLFLLLLFLSFGWLYDINLLLKRINLILQSNLLWLFMNWGNIVLLVFVIAILVSLVVIYVLAFKHIFWAQVMRNLRIILGVLLWMATVDSTSRAIRWLIFGCVLGESLIISRTFTRQFAIPRLILRCFRSLLGHQGYMIQKWINTARILLPQDLIWWFLRTLQHLLIDVCVL